MIITIYTMFLDMESVGISFLGFSNDTMRYDSDVRHLFSIMIDWNVKMVGVDLLWFHLL